MKKIPTKKSSANNKASRGSSDDAPRLTKKMLASSIAMPPISDPRWKKSMQRLQKEVHHHDMPVIHVDKEVLSWFKKQDKNYETRINNVLLHYVLSHQPNV